jgi:hypothetical protein
MRGLAGGLKTLEELRHLGLEFSIARREAVANVAGAIDHSLGLPQLVPRLEKEVDGLGLVTFRDRQAISGSGKVVLHSLALEGGDRRASRLVG